MAFMKVELPEQLKSDVPPTKWGKILAATPVVMAVVATMLAGLSSSEMTRAQYDRSLAAQQQSKAGDQWSFFQAKRQRGALQRNSLDVLQHLAQVRPLTVEGLSRVAGPPPAGTDQADLAKARAELRAALGSPPGIDALLCLERGTVPQVKPPPPRDANLMAALEAVESLKPESEIASLLARVNNQVLEDAIRAARDHAQAFDTNAKPVNQAIEQFESLLDRLSASAAAPGASISRDFTAARLRYAAERYEVEGRLNQAIAYLYELQVRKSNLSAERHHNRSQRFFYGMLAAQLGVIVSTFAMAARKRNMLWAIAAAAGLLAIAFAVYVYLWV